MPASTCDFFSGLAGLSCAGARRVGKCAPSHTSGGDEHCTWVQPPSGGRPVPHVSKDTDLSNADPNVCFIAEITSLPLYAKKCQLRRLTSEVWNKFSVSFAISETRGPIDGGEQRET